MTRLGAFVAVAGWAAAACGGVGAGPSVVQEARVEGLELVVTTCALGVRDKSPEVVMRECRTDRQRLPVVVASAEQPPQPAILDASRIAEGITPPVRDALAGCARSLDVAVLMGVHLVIDGDGRISSAKLTENRADVLGCVRAALTKVRFPRLAHATLTVWFHGTVPSPADAGVP